MRNRFTWFYLLAAGILGVAALLLNLRGAPSDALPPLPPPVPLAQAAGAMGLRPEQVLSHTEAPGGLLLLWEETPGRFTAGLYQAGGAGARHTHAVPGARRPFRATGDLTENLKAVYGWVEDPAITAVRVGPPGVDELIVDVTDGYWIAAVPGPADPAAGVPLAYMGAQGRAIAGDTLYPSATCESGAVEARRGYSRISLFFPCRREPFDSPPRPVGRLVPETRDDLTAALTELLKGPNVEERAAGFSSWFSDQTEDMLHSATVNDQGRAVIDFANFSAIIPNASTSAGSRGLMAELGRTVFQFPHIKEAEFRFDGSCEAFSHWLQSDCRAIEAQWFRRYDLSADDFTLAGIRLGMEQGEVRRLLGEPDQETELRGTSLPLWSYCKLGLAFAFESGTVSYMETTDGSAMQSHRGIGAGADEQAVADRYGTWVDLRLGRTAELTLREGAATLRFDFRDGAVIRLAVTQSR